MDEHQPDQGKKLDESQPQDPSRIVDSDPDEPEGDEEILELTDVVPTSSAEPDALDLSAPEATEQEGNVLEFKSQPHGADAPSIQAGDARENPVLRDLTLDEDLEDELDLDEDPDDFIGSLGVEIDDEEFLDSAPESELMPAAPDHTDMAADIGVDLTLTSEQVDMALERVIKKMFYDQIESTLQEIVGQMVTKEIEKIKKLLAEKGPEDA